MNFRFYFVFFFFSNGIGFRVYFVFGFYLRFLDPATSPSPDNYQKFLLIVSGIPGNQKTPDSVFRRKYVLR